MLKRVSKLADLTGCYIFAKALEKAIRVIRGLILVLAMGVLSQGVLAATGSSPEFKIDLRGLGPWQRRTAAASEVLTYSSAWATNAANGAKAVVKVMPVLKTKPKYLVIDLSGGTDAMSFGISYHDEVPGGTWSDEYKTSKLVLRHIPADSFIMGGRATDYPGAVNTDLHMVTITRDFYMGVFEVTQRQWELVMGTRPSSFTNDAAYATRPVETVNYDLIRGNADGSSWPSSTDVDVPSFIGVIRRKTNLSGLDLPSEAQWEYAARAGTTTALYTGKNITWTDDYWAGVDAALNGIAQYANVSGWAALGSERQSEIIFQKPTVPIADLWPEANQSGTLGTIAAGLYCPNDFGLYDLYGNVWELCLDRFNGVDPNPSVDPRGAKTNDLYRVGRGGSFVSDVACSSSTSRRESKDQAGLRCFDIGFRLCLQGGDIPDLASASMLVNESGCGSQSWAPIRSGVYYLTHATMNETTNVQLASAWFDVAGCTLTLEPQGELTNGVMIAINGADEGWTVYYTTNGLAPSKASEPYIGPFSLPESGTVRAVAYNEQGVASEETTATFTLHDALSVVGAVARQWYPWNGMVDVDVELTGDPEAKYQVEVEAKDLDGGTNLPVKTIYVDAIETIASTGVIALSPSTHRLTWNAGADVAADGEFPRVAVTVKATRQSVMAAYNRSLSITVGGYTGTETLTNLPVLVRLSTAIDGFDYRDFASPSNGADMAIFDADENELPYEIDEWHTNGESLVWVKLPTLVKGTTFTCAYGNPDRVSRLLSQVNADKHTVWAEYAGVWHMNEDSGTAYDSTEHGLDALPSCGTNKLADVSQMVAYESGACGRARVNATVALQSGNMMEVPSYDGLGLGGSFVLTGWFSFDKVEGYPRLFSRKRNDQEQTGFELLTHYNDPVMLSVRGSAYPTEGEVKFYVPPLTNGWVNIALVYAGNGVVCPVL